MQGKPNPQDFVAIARRNAFKEDVIAALDAAESVYRQLQDMPREVAMTDGQVAAMRNYAAEAYRALSNARHVITDAENDDRQGR